MSGTIKWIDIDVDYGIFKEMKKWDRNRFVRDTQKEHSEKQAEVFCNFLHDSYIILGIHRTLPLPKLKPYGINIRR